MILSLDETKAYLRVDTDVEDNLIENLITTSEQLVRDISRLDCEEIKCHKDKLKVAALYATAFLYEHREEADHKALTLSLRALLFGVREAKF